MNFYKDIPAKVSDFVIERDYMSMVGDYNHGHDWRFVDTDYFLTDYAQNWFRERGVALKKQSSLFKADAGSIWPIHTDSKVNDLGINFVLQGTGEMQWVEPVGAEESMYQEHGVEYPVYRNAKEILVLGAWAGTCGVVNIKVPHRISTVNSSVPRICFSLRPDRTRCDMTFSQLASLV